MKKKNVGLCSYIQYLCRANNNHAAVNIVEKQKGQYFWDCFSTDIPKIVSLEEK